MGIIKSNERGFYGVKRRLFTVVFKIATKQYCYYMNVLWTNNLGDVMIYKSTRKSKLLNKFTMSVIGIFYSIYKYLIKLPIGVLVFPFYLYFDGCRNFVRNTAWYNNVRYFNWANIIIICGLILWIVLK